MTVLSFVVIRFVIGVLYRVDRALKCASIMNRSFNLVAPFYVLLEKLSFGDALNIARRAFIETVIGANSTLLIGEGNGRFLQECLQNKTGGSFTILDSSRRMLDLLSIRIRKT